MENKYFYCYSMPLKDFLKSQGLKYITKAINPRTNTTYFMFEKGEDLDKAICKWQKMKYL
jgi:hypothetical protein